MKSLSKILFFSLTSLTMMFSLETANAESKKLCGQDLAYQPVPLSTTVPRTMSPFYGIWQGRTLVNSEYSSCTAFVVQQIDVSGRVFVQQAWGVDNGASGNWAANPKDIGKTTEAWGGHIMDGTLVLISKNVTYQLTVDKNNPNKMTGYVYDAVHGRYPVTLDRVGR